jgi:hypothetical protein
MVVYATMGTVMVYLLGAAVVSWPPLAFGLAALALAATGWMAVRILKAPYSPDESFDVQFYQDRDDLRRSRAR